jgi:hypothetical protein
VELRRAEVASSHRVAAGCFTALLAFTLLTVACEQLPEIRYETEHLRIGTNYDAPLCRGDLDHFELVVTTLEERLGTTVTEPVTVYLWDENPGWCTSEYASGCFRDGVVYGDALSVDHELVHAVIATFASPAALWNEGAAEALQSDRTLRGSSTPVANLDRTTLEVDYLTAGHFSRWLVETRGIETYRSLLRAGGSARVAFEDTYAMTIEDAQAQYLSEAPYSYGALIGCEHPELPQVDALTWSDTLEVDCANADVHATTGGLGAFRVLTITARDDYAFSTSAALGVISRCDDEDLASPPMTDDPEFADVPPITDAFVYQYTRIFGADGEVTVLDLVPGRYEVAVGSLDYEARTERLDVTATSGPP